MPGRSLRLAAALLTVLAGKAVAEPVTIGSLRFLGATNIPNTGTVQGALVGGLSGLDYDPKSGTWVMISDHKAGARIFRGSIELDDGAPRLKLLDTQLLDLKNGETSDAEAIRFDPRGDALWWSDEGDRERGQSPFIRKTAPKTAPADLPLPPIFTMHRDRDVGPRHNNAIEGISFTPDGDALWASMESALYQDGPVATVDAGAIARFTKFDRDGRVLGQYAYPLDPIQARSAEAKSDNGVSEILALSDDRLLVIERSGVNHGSNTWSLHIRLYEADASRSSDVAAMESLVGADYRPMTKRLILNLDALPQLGTPELTKIDNIEGVSFGPDLPNGRRSLVLVSDNNFNPHQITQFLAFEVVP